MIPLEDAYERLHAAIVALGRIDPPDGRNATCLGNNTLAAARMTLETYQVALLVRIDGIDPETMRGPQR